VRALLLKDPEGCFVAEEGSQIRENVGDDLAAIQILAIHPEYTSEDTFYTLVSESEYLGYSLKKRKLTVPVNTSHAWTIKQLLQSGFRVERMAVRMELEGTDRGPAADSWVNCSRWAG
jgi:hypothetical protein